MKPDAPASQATASCSRKRAKVPPPDSSAHGTGAAVVELRAGVAPGRAVVVGAGVERELDLEHVRAQATEAARRLHHQRTSVGRSSLALVEQGLQEQGDVVARAVR